MITKIVTKRLHDHFNSHFLNKSQEIMTMKIVMKAPYDQNTDHSWLFSGHDHQIAKTRDSSNVQALSGKGAGYIFSTIFAASNES
jgi:hypothetical protein